MSKTLVAPENEIFSDRIRWTRRDCERLEKAGVLPERYELIDGEIISKMGAKPPHSSVITLFARWLMLVFGFDFIRNQMPLPIPGILGKTNEPLPDIAVTVAPFTEYFTRNPTPAEIVLLIEVSDSTLRMDKTAKALLYARAGIREYWIANVAKREIICHRRPKQAGYIDIVTLRFDEMAAPQDRPDDSIRVSDLFPPPATAE